MSRSLAGFLVFLGVLVAIGLLGTWYLGPTLVGLAFDEERRNAPYYLLNFAAGESAADYQSTYRAGLAELVVAEGGQLLWQANTLQVAEGRVQDEWQDIQLFEFARGGEFVQMLTSSSYRGIVDAHPNVSRMLLGTSTPPDALAGNRATVLSLLSVDPQQDGWADTIRRLFSNLPGYEGTVIWDAEVEDLADEWPWNYALMVTFPSVAQAENWLRDPATVTERALTATAAKQRVTLILQ